MLAEHKKQTEIDMQHQFVATVGISLVSMAEGIGTEMSMRMMEHLMTYGEISVRRAVPIALGECSRHTRSLGSADGLRILKGRIGWWMARRAGVCLEPGAHRHGDAL